MNPERLKKNLMDVLEEDQLKLGYRKETVRLFYPRRSVCYLLGISPETDRLKEELDRFRHAVEPELGTIQISYLKDGRIGFSLPPEAAEFVHRTRLDVGFLKDLVELMRHHGHSLDDVIHLFSRYSPAVEIQYMKNEEFDLLLHFPDGYPDDYYYCITKEGEHISYHRFIREDYEDLQIQNQ